ncbi:MAG: calcium-binding protein [Geminicoccaceae bacterium]
MALVNGTNGNDIGVFALNGTADADLILGLNGIDQLTGYGGADTLMGGLGNDLLFGGQGIDTASYVYSTSGVYVALGEHRSLAMYGAEDHDSLLGIENVTGSALHDYIIGDDGANTLRGEGGSDQLEGGGGADELIGGAGEDYVYYSGSAFGVTVNLAKGTGSGGDAEGDTLSGIENLHGSEHTDYLTGNGYDNALFGHAGNDVLKGGGGADLLSGDSGKDEIWGGGGADRFVFHPGESGDTKAAADRIADFSHLQGDKIDLSGFATSGLPYPGYWSFTFIGSKSFSGEHQVRAVVENGNTYVGLNETGTSGAEEWIRLDGVHTLHAGDFIL